jgi:hypothetical protein
MDIGERIKSFALLGETLQNYLKNCSATIGGIGCDISYLNTLIDNQIRHNPWFTAENVRLAITAIAEELTEDNLTCWTKAYPYEGWSNNGRKYTPCRFS